MLYQSYSCYVNKWLLLLIIGSRPESSAEGGPREGDEQARAGRHGSQPRDARLQEDVCRDKGDVDEVPIKLNNNY